MNSKNSTPALPRGAMLEAAQNLGFYLFFLALRGLRPYSARRARRARFEAAGAWQSQL